jgi:hypothetical protein
VISVDTSVLHLAGALARPVWGLLSHVSCWRWMQRRTDSPWYPTLKLFRQPRPRDWASVMAQVEANLRQLCERRKQGESRVSVYRFKPEQLGAVGGEI